MVRLKNDIYLATLPPPGKAKWRPQSRECGCFSILTIYKMHISASIAHSNEIETATPTFSGSIKSMVLLPIIYNIIGARKSKMAATYPEVLISQLVDEIENRFQRLTPHFRGPATQWYYGRFCPTKGEFRKPRWRPLNRKYLYLSL